MKYFPFLIFIIISCNVSNPEVKKETNAFFDINSFFKKELDRTQEVKAFHKTIQLNETKEEKTLDNLALEKEFKIFSQSDINRTAWLDKYKIDSLFNNQGVLNAVRYQAKEDQLRTRSLFVSFVNAEVDSIKIHNLSSSTIADAEQFLTYIPKSGYTIQTRQKINLLSEHNLTVEVKFVY